MNNSPTLTPGALRDAPALAVSVRQPALAADLAARGVDVRAGDFDQPEFPEQGRDEVAVLASSFNRMRRSLEKAMQMIDG